MDKRKQIKIFDKQASSYAKRRESHWLIQARRRLLGQAAGDVLELAVGAGANLTYYPSRVRKVTAVDFSPAMLERAKRAAAGLPITVEFVCSDVETLAFPDASFDTVVSTLSFCSYRDPLAVMRQLNRWCKPGGTILLMEHGISSYAIVSAGQKLLNPLLYRIIGCHHTRDILGLVGEAGIRIDRSERHWLQMLHLIWARPGL